MDDYKLQDQERRDRAEVDRAVIEDNNRRDAMDSAGREPIKRGRSSPIHWGLPGERTAVAHFIVKMGWGAVVLGVLLWILHLAMPAMIGELVPGSVIGLGGFCLILVYFFQVVGMVLLVAAFLLLWNAGTTPDGFKLSAIPIPAYLAAGGLMVFTYILRRLLARD